MSQDRGMTDRGALLSLLLLAMIMATIPGRGVGQENAEKEIRRDRHVVRLHDHGPSRGFLGVQVLELTPELLSHYGVGTEGGVLVSRVEVDSPAENAGMAVGDVLVEVAGQPVSSMWDLRRHLAPHQAGDQVGLLVFRDGSPQELKAVVVEREARVLYVKPHLAVQSIGDDHVVVGAHEAESEVDWHAVAEGVQEALHDPDREWIGEDVERVVRSQLMIMDESPETLRVIRLQEAEGLLKERLEALELRLEELEQRLEEEE